MSGVAGVCNGIHWCATAEYLQDNAKKRKPAPPLMVDVSHVCQLVRIGIRGYLRKR
jgi:hypothetical protein